MLHELLEAVQTILTKCHGLPEAIRNSTFRHELEPYVFQILNQEYGSFFHQHWNTCTIPTVSEKAIVIVERRPHPNLQFCLQNAAYYCPGYAIHIVCSQENLKFVQKIVEDQLSNVHIHPVFEGVGTVSEGYKDYNEMLKTKAFWERFQEEHIITLETDCYFMKPLPESVYQYDYVASRWPWLSEQPGGGGLSYRKRSVMLRICDEFEGKLTIPAQDAFVSHGIKQLGYKYPSLEENSNYFTECMYSQNAIGTHQWWTFISQIFIGKNDTTEIVKHLHTVILSYLVLKRE